MDLPIVSAVLAVALTSTAARRPRFPALAAVLGFAVGYLRNVAAVALPLWRNGFGITTSARPADARTARAPRIPRQEDPSP